MNIAYVEDNLVNLALIQRIASMNNHAVTSFTEGEVALNELMRQPFDLILMDVELAGEMNGLQVVRGLRARGLTTPIVAVTAYAMLGDRERCLEAGCTDYLSKPLSIPETLTLLARYDAILLGQPVPPPQPVPEPVITATAQPVPPERPRKPTAPLSKQKATVAAAESDKASANPISTPDISSAAGTAKVKESESTPAVAAQPAQTIQMAPTPIVVEKTEKQEKSEKPGEPDQKKPIDPPTIADAQTASPVQTGISPGPAPALSTPAAADVSKPTVTNAEQTAAATPRTATTNGVKDSRSHSQQPADPISPLPPSAPTST